MRRLVLAAALACAAIAFTACDNDSQPAAAAVGGAVAGPSPVTVPTGAIAVFSGYTPIPDSGEHAVGRRGWSVAAPALEYFIENPGTTDLLLTASPPVSIIEPGNAGSFEITQPALTRLRPGQSTRFAIRFTVPQEGAFGFAVDVPSNASHGQGGGSFDFKVSGLGAPELLYTQSVGGQWLPFVNGAADGNLERAVLAGLPAGANSLAQTAVSPDGAYLAYVPGESAGADRHVRVAALAGGAPVVITPPVASPRASHASRVAWGQDAQGRQLLAIATSMYVRPAPLAPGLSLRLYTCVISGTQPAASHFTEVTGHGGELNLSVSSPRWTADGTRLGYVVNEYEQNGQNISLARGAMWGCAFADGMPGASALLNGTPALEGDHWVTRFEWADNTTLVFATWGDLSSADPTTALHAVPISQANGLLTAGVRVRQTPDYGKGEAFGDWGLSPNGKRIVFSQIDPAHGAWPWVVEISTLSRRPAQLLAAGFTPTGVSRAWGAAWSPDSRTVAFWAHLPAQPSEFGPLRGNVYFQRLKAAAGPTTLEGPTTRLTNFNVADLQEVGQLEFGAEGARLLFGVKLANFHSLLYLQRVAAGGLISVVAENLRGVDEFGGNYSLRPLDGGMAQFTATDGNIYLAPLSGRQLMGVGAPFVVNGRQPTGFKQWLK